MDCRFNEFIKEVLNKDNDKTIIVIHGIMLLSYLQNNCDFEFENGKTFANYNNKIIVNEKPKSPGVYKITYQDAKVVDIDVLN